MTKVEFKELAKHFGKEIGPLKRIVFTIMVLIAPGSTLIVFAKTFLQLSEDYDDAEIKELLEAIKNA